MYDFNFLKYVYDCFMDVDIAYLGECPWVLDRVFVVVVWYDVLYLTVRFYCYAKKKIIPGMVLYQPQTPSQECFFPPCQRESEMFLLSS